MAKKIKVAYDISLLGIGHISNQSRTGIFRAIEEILLGLHKREDISVNALALNQDSTILEDISSLFYCQSEQPNIANSFCSIHSSRLCIEHIYKAIIQIQKSLLSSSSSRKSMRYRAGRALQIVASELAKKESSLSDSLDDYDIYHSSYFSLPDDGILPNTQRVFTIYDLIPVIFPEFVVPAVHSRFVEMIQSINAKRDWILCISEHTRNDLCEYTGINPNRVSIAPLAAASRFYRVESHTAINQTLDRYGIPRDPYVMSLCTLEPRKNIEMLIRAFSDLVQSNPSEKINLVLVGINGWKNKKIFEAVEKEKMVRNRIFLTGYLPDEDLAPIYSGASMFVYPSLYEGFGLPPLEAMQCGIPVIASNVSSLPEVIGEAGILINPKNQNDLSHAMWSLVNDKRLQQELSKKSLLRASQFTWEKSVEKTVNAYRNAIEDKD